ncbi:hypothetical protein [uncultured Bacteroides sp.]|uniref:hypothetical protein n=1 Tax=uncultured Bacteroides sp. TaxID=162156 RepID=UPI000E549ECE|nr:hypothetical protein [uncultured Bacteroides sp.]RHP59469.1 hypothetical protein DXA74_15435 [Bacteroides sp. OF04-15BH]
MRLQDECRYTKHIYIGSQRVVSKIGDFDSYGSDPRRIQYAGSETDGLSVVAQNSSISLDEITRQRCGHHDQQQFYCSCSCISSKLIILFPIFLITEYVLTSDVFTVRSPSASYQ